MVIARTRLLGAFLHNDLLLREDLRGEIFLPLCKNSELSQKNQTLTLSSLSNSLLLHLTLSLSLSSPSQPKPGGEAQPRATSRPRTAARRGRARPRRGGARPREGGAGPGRKGGSLFGQDSVFRWF